MSGAIDPRIAAIERVVAKHPDLTSHGFGVYNRSRMTPEEYAVKFAAERAEMFTPQCLAEFEMSCEFLNGIRKTKTIRHNIGPSNGLKRRVEWWAQKYISNGMFIAAAAHCGFTVERIRHGSPNAFFNMSARDVDAKHPGYSVNGPRGAQ